MIHRFAKALTNYEDQAHVQRHMVQTLTEYLAQYFHTFTPRIVELGCGTGMLSRTLLKRFAPSELVVNDICPDVAVCFNNVPRTTFVVGDAERIDLPQGVDLIASASAMQWFSDPCAFLKKAYHALNPGGMIAIATFGPQNLAEVKAITGAGLAYQTLQEMQTLFSPHFKLLVAEESIEVLTFETAMALLYHLKHTGVTATNTTTVWTRKVVADFEQTYRDRFEVDNVLPLTYHPIYLVGVKL